MSAIRWWYTLHEPMDGAKLVAALSPMDLLMAVQEYVARTCPEALREFAGQDAIISMQWDEHKVFVRVHVARKAGETGSELDSSSHQQMASEQSQKPDP